MPTRPWKTWRFFCIELPESAWPLYWLRDSKSCRPQRQLFEALRKPLHDSPHDLCSHVQMTFPFVKKCGWKAVLPPLPRGVLQMPLEPIPLK